jgi:hypothetical protein
VEGKRHSGLLEVSPQPFIGRIMQRRNARELLRPPPDTSEAESLHASTCLPESVISVGHRQSSDADEALALSASAAILNYPVIDGSTQRQRRSSLRHSLDHETERGVQRSDADGVSIHVMQASDRITSTCSRNGH